MWFLIIYSANTILTLALILRISQHKLSKFISHTVILFIQASKEKRLNEFFDLVHCYYKEMLLILWSQQKNLMDMFQQNTKFQTLYFQ